MATKKPISTNIRYFNEVKDNTDGTITKSFRSNDKKYQGKFLAEIQWMVNVPKILKPYIPTIHKYKFDLNKLSITMDKLYEPTIHELIFNNKIKTIPWNSIAEAYNTFFAKCKKCQIKNLHIRDWTKKLLNFYLVRTCEDIKLAIKSNELIKECFWDVNNVIINNKKYPSLQTIYNFIDSIIIKATKHKQIPSLFSKLITPSKSRICTVHLDMVFSNVFYNSETKSIKVVDPRGVFADSYQYGDLYYDYAKIIQCVDSRYDFIVKDLFSYKIDEKNNSIEYNIQTNKKLEQAKKIVNEIVPKKDMDVVKLIEALQFFCMIPAHDDKPNRQFVQMCNAVRLFCALVKVK